MKQDIDTTTPTGRLVFHVLASIDEFQRELIVENTYEGLAAARARGRVGGRKPKLSPDQRILARQLYDAKQHTVEQIAAMFGVQPAHHLPRDPRPYGAPEQLKRPSAWYTVSATATARQGYGWTALRANLAASGHLPGTLARLAAFDAQISLQSRRLAAKFALVFVHRDV